MSNAARGSGLLTAGLGWGAALGIALGMLLIAPAMHGTLGPANAAATSSADSIEDEASASDESLRAGAEADAANALLAAESETILADALVDVPVMIVRTSGAHEDDIAGVRKFAAQAGASDAGEVVLTPKFFQRDAADELSNIVANTLPAGAQLSVENRSPGAHAGESLAAALAIDPDTGEAFASDADRALVLESLAEAGFVENPGEVSPAGVVIILTGELSPNEGGGNFSHQVLLDFADALGSKAHAVLATPGVALDTAHAHAVGHIDTDAGRMGAVLSARELMGGQQ